MKRKIRHKTKRKENIVTRHFVAVGRGLFRVGHLVFFTILVGHIFILTFYRRWTSATFVLFVLLSLLSSGSHV